jgi:hypothetical protein
MITVLGASGFIGSHLVKRLEERGIPCNAPGRDQTISTGNAGDVIYCIGLTSDFRSRPFDTVRAHVCKLLEVLQDWEFDSLLYVSSTRLYRSDMPEAREEDSFQFNSLNPSDLYKSGEDLERLWRRLHFREFSSLSHQRCSVEEEGAAANVG